MPSLTIRLTDDELIRVRAEAEARAMTASDYVRHRLRTNDDLEERIAGIEARLSHDYHDLADAVHRQSAEAVREHNDRMRDHVDTRARGRRSPSSR